MHVAEQEFFCVTINKKFKQEKMSVRQTDFDIDPFNQELIKKDIKKISLNFNRATNEIHLLFF